MLSEIRLGFFHLELFVWQCSPLQSDFTAGDWFSVPRWHSGLETVIPGIPCKLKLIHQIMRHFDIKRVFFPTTELSDLVLTGKAGMEKSQKIISILPKKKEGGAKIFSST